MPHESLILHRPFLQRSGIFGKLLAHKHIALVAWHSIWSKTFYQNVTPSADGSDRFFPGSGSSWWRGLGGGYVFPYPANFWHKNRHTKIGVSQRRCSSGPLSRNCELPVWPSASCACLLATLMVWGTSGNASLRINKCFVFRVWSSSVVNPGRLVACLFPLQMAKHQQETNARRWRSLACR